MGFFDELTKGIRQAAQLMQATNTARGATPSATRQTTQPQTVRLPSARQRMMYTPEEDKWYRGENPTSGEVAARIYQIGQSDPNKGRQLWDAYNQFTSDPTSPIYNPYSRATNNAVQELSALGFDMSGGVNDDWFERNSWLKSHYRTGASGNPLAPSSKSSAEQNAAYWYYQLWQDEERTKRAETEWAALKEEVSYWASRKDRNYSDEEILARINWSNYPTLKDMDASRQKGVPTSLNRSMLGGAAFVAESVTEYIPMDKMLGAFAKGEAGTVRGVLADVAVSALSGGLGEMASDALGRVSDDWIMGELSSYHQTVQRYQTEGLTKAQAEQQATHDFVRDLIYTGIVGGLSEGLSTGGAYVAGAALRKADTPVNDAGSPETPSSVQTDNLSPDAEQGQRSEAYEEAEPDNDGMPLMERTFGPDEDLRQQQEATAAVTSRQAAALTMAASSGDAAAQAATVGAALAPREATPDTTSASALAAQELVSTHGERGVTMLRDALLTAAETGVDPETVKTAVVAAMLGEGRAKEELADVVKSGADAQSVERLTASVQEAMQNPETVSHISSRIADGQIAAKTAELVSDGALEGLRSYEDAVTQARLNANNARKSLEVAQARQTATAQNLQSATAEFVRDPSNQTLRGAVQQAVKDAEGAVKVVEEYAQSVQNAEAALQNATTTLQTIRDTTMRKVREQAQAELVAEAQQQQDAQQQQQALYDEAVAKTQPSIPFGKLVQAPTQNGVLDFTGFYGLGDDGWGSPYFTAANGKVYSESELTGPELDDFMTSTEMMNLPLSDDAWHKPHPAIAAFSHSVTLKMPDGSTAEAVGLMKDTPEGFLTFKMLDGNELVFDNSIPLPLTSLADISMVYDTHDAHTYKLAPPVTAATAGTQTTEATADTQVQTIEATADTQVQTAQAEPELQLEPWQDPQYHGKVKPLRKLRTNTKNFANWFSDPSGDLSNADGTPRLIFRGTGSTLYMEHKAGSHSGGIINFYSPDLSIATTYAHGSKHRIRTYDIVNWETAAAAMKAEGYELRKMQNNNNEWGYRAYGVEPSTQLFRGPFYRENELAKFNKEYGGIRRDGLYTGYVSLKKPLVIDAHGAVYTGVHATVKDKNGNNYTDTRSNRNWGIWARSQGYDGCIVRNVRDNLSNNAHAIPGTVIMTFDSSTFKSMYNTGKLGKKTDDIRYNKSGAFALTGEPISSQMEAVRKQLELGTLASMEDVMNTPEVQWAVQHTMKGDSIPYSPKPYTPDEMAALVTPERASLQMDIAEELMALGSAVIDSKGKTEYTGSIKQERRLDIVIGPPAAGKSSALVNPLSQQYGSRVLDSDMVKERLPEYNGGLNSGYLHTESRYIWEQMKAQARENGDNVILPVVGHSLKSVMRDIMDFAGEGSDYNVHVHYVTLPSQKTIGRALSRFLSEGRYIDPDYLNTVSDGRIDTVYQQLKDGGMIDGYSKWSNDVPRGQSPKLLEASDTETFKLREQGTTGGTLSGVDAVAAGGGGGMPGNRSLSEQKGIAYKKGAQQATLGASSTNGQPKKSPHKIAKELVKKLGIGDSIGTRKMNNMPSEVLGYYEGRARYIAVRSRKAGDYTVTMHEAFHHLANRLGMTGTQDMVGKLDPLFAANYSAAQLPGEAFAEFGWRYIADENAARAFAGDAFVDTFQRNLRTNGLYDTVQQAATDLRAWLNASCCDQIGATIRNRSERGNGGGIRKQFRDAIARLVDDTAAAEKVDHDVRAQGGEADLRKNALMKNFASRRAFSILTENLTDASWSITGDSLATRFEQAGITAENRDMLNRYMLALHSLDRDAQGKPVFDEHITPAARNAFIQDVQRNHPEVVAGEQAFQDFRKEFLQSFLVDTGFLTQEAFDMMNRMYPHYVPTYRVKNMESGKPYRNSKRYQMRAATGSTEDIIDPMDSFVSMVDSIVTMVSANNAALAWDKAYQSYDGLGVYGRIITPDMQQVSVDTTALREQIAGLLEGNTADDIYQQVVRLIGDRQTQWVTRNGSSVENVVTVQHADGSRSYYQMEDTELYRLLSSQRDGGTGAWQLIGKLTRGMSALTTGSNPVFAVRNFMRDFQNSVNYGSWASNYIEGAAKWLRSAYEVWSEGGEYSDYVALGGGGWTRIETGTKKGANDYRRALYRGYATSSPGRALKWAGEKAWNAITLARLNEIVEQTSRYAEYRYGKHDKTTATGRRDAFLASQDVTVDFARTGNSQTASVLKQVIPFFGASEQGIYRTARMLTEAERGRAPQRFAKTVINTALASAISAAIMLKYSDDDEKEAFERMSDDLKAQHFYLPNIAPEVLGNQPLVRIPLAQDPLTYAVHSAVTNALWHGTTDGLVIELAATANTIVDNLNAVSSGSVFQPLIGIGKNENWYGSRIVPSYMSDWEETTQYTEETPDMFIHAGRAVGLSPLKVQYLAEQYTGFLGQMLIPAFSKAGNTGELGGLDAAISAAQKRLTSDPLISNDIVGSFYDGYNLLSSVLDAAKYSRPLNMLRRGLSDEEATAAYERAYELTHAGGIAYDTRKQITELYDQIDGINANPTLTDGEKYTLTSEKRREMISIALTAQEALGGYMDTYVRGGNLVTNALMEGSYATIPTAMDKLDATFKQDSGLTYMQRATAVYEATGSDSALPHPNRSFSVTDKVTREKVTYTVTDDEWGDYCAQYKRGYTAYLATNGKLWTTLDAQSQLELLRGAHTAGHNAAKAWYTKLHKIKAQ